MVVQLRKHTNRVFVLILQTGQQLVLTTCLYRLFRVDLRQLIEILLHPLPTPLPTVVLDRLFYIIRILLNLENLLLVTSVLLRDVCVPLVV